MPEFLALVGRGNTGFRDVFAPGSIMLADEGGTVSMSHVVGITDRLKWCIWIPPGTRSLQSTLFVYASPPESKVLLRMHTPPIGNLNSVTPENAAAVDLTNVLATLLSGAEVPYWAPPVVAGNIKLSDGRIDSPVLTTTGGWLYIHALQLPGNQIFELVARLTVDKAQYLNWYANAVWDELGNPVEGKPAPVVPPPSHEDRVLQACKDSGLIDGLCLMLGGVTTEAMARKAVASGVWASLLKMVP